MTIRFFEDFNSQRMKRDIFFNLMKQIKDCVADDQALGDKFQTQQAAFIACYERLDDAIMKSRKSLLTPEIQRLDNQRVQLWKIINATAKESVKLPGEAVSDNAEFVLSLIKNHGDVPTMKVNERSGALTNLCQDLTTKYTSQVEAIGLSAFATQLSTANAEYVQLYEQRLHEWSEYTPEAVQNARNASEIALENLCIMVASGILTEGFADYKHFVDYVNEAIKVAKIAMGVSTSKPEGGEGEQTPGEGENQQPGSGEQTPPAEQEPTTPPAGGGNTGEEGEEEEPPILS